MLGDRVVVPERLAHRHPGDPELAPRPEVRLEEHADGVPVIAVLDGPGGGPRPALVAVAVHPGAAADRPLVDRSFRRGLEGLDRELDGNVAAVDVVQVPVPRLGGDREQPRLGDVRVVLRGPGDDPGVAIPTACVFVIAIGPAAVPDSSIQETPVISPLPFCEWKPAAYGSPGSERPRGWIAVTPVRTSSPEINVTKPTSTPGTSVIAFHGPGSPSNGIPSARRAACRRASRAADRSRGCRRLAHVLDASPGGRWSEGYHPGSVRTPEGAPHGADRSLHRRQARAGRVGPAGPVFDPATGEQTHEVDFADPAELDTAVDAAKEAFWGWRATSLSKRAEIMFTIRELPRGPQDRRREGPDRAARQGAVGRDRRGARGLENVEYATAIPQLLKGGSEQASTGVDVFDPAAGRRGRRHHALQLPGHGPDLDVRERDRVRQHVHPQALGEAIPGRRWCSPTCSPRPDCPTACST